MTQRVQNWKLVLVSQIKPALNPPFASFCKVDRLHGDNVSGKFTVTLETCCDVLPDYGQIQSALSERFGVNWLLVVLATCGISLGKFPRQHVLLINDKDLFYQHMRGANLYVQVSDSLSAKTRAPLNGEVVNKTNSSRFRLSQEMSTPSDLQNTWALHHQERIHVATSIVK